MALVLSESNFVSWTVNAMFVCCSFVLSPPFIAQNIFTVGVDQFEATQMSQRVEMSVFESCAQA